MAQKPNKLKRVSLVLIAAMMVLPIISFAQATPKIPDAWIAFQKAEKAKRDAFFQQMKVDRDAFLNAHPDVKAYFDEMRATAKQRLAEWRATHHK